MTLKCRNCPLLKCHECSIVSTANRTDCIWSSQNVLDPLLWEPRSIPFSLMCWKNCSTLVGGGGVRNICHTDFYLNKYQKVSSSIFDCIQIPTLWCGFYLQTKWRRLVYSLQFYALWIISWAGLHQNHKEFVTCLWGVHVVVRCVKCCYCIHPVESAACLWNTDSLALRLRTPLITRSFCCISLCSHINDLW